jgi:type IV pilus assembly protein PilB
MSAHSQAGGRFLDEWLVRIAIARLGVAPEVVARLRAAGRKSLAEALIAEGATTLVDLRATLLGEYRIQTVSPGREDVDPFAAGLMPEALCRRWNVLPLKIEDDRLELAMANPLDVEALDDVRGVTGRTPAPFYCLPSELAALIDLIHNPEGAVLELLEKVDSGDTVEIIQDEDSTAPGPGVDVRAPVIRLVNMLIANAVRRRASDIHIEHEEHGSVVRYRIDGTLRTVVNLPLRLAAGAVLARLKIMAALDIADHMRPQDGRAHLRVSGHDIGLRVSTLPTQHGEKAVIRILDRRSAEVPLDALGFPPEQAARIKGLAGAAQGVIIVTGPTGSGKTTTLYSLLNILRGDDVNIVTIEDPVEYRIDKINQVQVLEKQGLGFAQVMRSVLRQDPDIIMVGEIRDRETAEIAIQAAMTGHLVLTTLHANDSLAAVARLADMGVEPYKIGPALLGVTAQRLARRLCEKCRKLDDKTPYYRPGACEDCDLCGYRGRLSLLELFTPDAELRAMIASGERADALRRRAVERGCLHELSADVLWHLKRGDTSLEEVAPYCDPRLLSAAQPAPAPRAPEPAPASGGAGRRPRVLVADDDASTRLLLKLALERGGCEAIEAADGREALGLAGGVDLVLTDLNMPNMGGAELVDRLHGGAATKNLPIIVLTVETDELSQQKVLEAGADDYISKPFKAPLLIARVKAALRRRAETAPAAVAV